MATYGDVSKQFLKAIGVSNPSDAQVQAVTNWIATEKPAPGSTDKFFNNPMNTTLGTPFSFWTTSEAQGPDKGANNYHTLDQGIAANAATFLEGTYSKPRNDLIFGNINAFYTDLAASKWAGSHYKGGIRQNVAQDTPYGFKDPSTGQSNANQPIGGSGGNAPAGQNASLGQAAADAVLGNGSPVGTGDQNGLLFYMQKFGFYVLGFALIIIGFFLLFESTKAGQAITKVAATA